VGSASFLADLSDDLLACALRGLAETRTENPEPDRVFPHHAVPPVDVCVDSTGQLTVHWDVSRGIHGLAAIPRQPVAPKTCAVLWQGIMVVQLWRCWPGPDQQGTPPPLETVADATDALQRDGWCLLTQVTGEHFAGTLFADVGCEQVTLGSLVPLGPLGNAAGWQMTLTVALEDGGPALTPVPAS
jgi:hypothetical protein